MKNRKKKLEEFRIEKEDELEWKILRPRIRFFGYLCEQKVETIK